MEYNLLKTIEPSLQRIFTPSASFSHMLTPFPAHDFVNTGDLFYFNVKYQNIRAKRVIGLIF